MAGKMFCENRWRTGVWQVEWKWNNGHVRKVTHSILSLMLTCPPNNNIKMSHVLYMGALGIYECVMIAATSAEYHQKLKFETTASLRKHVPKLQESCSALVHIHPKTRPFTKQRKVLSRSLSTRSVRVPSFPYLWVKPHPGAH